MSVAEILHEKQVLNYAGAGNIVAAICSGGKTRSLVSMNGTAGHTVGKIQQFAYLWTGNLHSSCTPTDFRRDGVRSSTLGWLPVTRR